MVVNLNEAINTIKCFGANNVRAVPMPGQAVTGGQYMIEVNDGGSWRPVIEGITRQTADGIINQATNRVLLG